MKKVFALVLAVAMVMSLAAVSFAAPGRAAKIISDVTNTDKNNESFAIVGPYRYSGDDHAMYPEVVQYGKAAYYMLLQDLTVGGSTFDNTKLVDDYNAVEKLKVKIKYEMGSDLVSGVSIVKKNISGGVRVNSGRGSTPITVAKDTRDYAYFVEIKTVDPATTSDSDIIATLTFNQRKSNDFTAAPAFELDDLDLDISINLTYEANYTDDSGNYYIGKPASEIDTMKPGDKYLVKFDEDDEIDINFGVEPNEGTFTVDVSGQGKLLMMFTTDADEAIVAANPNAKMAFLNFNNIKFNRTGEFAYESEDYEFVYEIKDGKLTTIPTAEYDAADETIYFNTRVLGSYVFSDVELVDAPEVPAEAGETPDVAAPVENPGTGAAA